MCFQSSVVFYRLFDITTIVTMLTETISWSYFGSSETEKQQAEHTHFPVQVRLGAREKGELNDSKIIAAKHTLRLREIFIYCQGMNFYHTHSLHP